MQASVFCAHIPLASWARIPSTNSNIPAWCRWWSKACLLAPLWQKSGAAGLVASAFFISHYGNAVKTIVYIDGFNLYYRLKEEPR